MNASDPKAYTIQGVDSMSTPLANPLPLAPVEDKATLIDFDGGRLSSDGGLVLLGDPDDQLGLTRDFAAVLRDPRDPRRVDFTLHDLLKQRVLQIAAGRENQRASQNPGGVKMESKTAKDRFPNMSTKRKGFRRHCF